MATYGRFLPLRDLHFRFQQHQLQTLKQSLGTVTLLGSHALGGIVLTLGIVSAPLWPVLAGVVGGAGFGYVAYMGTKYFGKPPGPERDD